MVIKEYKTGGKSCINVHKNNTYHFALDFSQFVFDLTCEGSMSVQVGIDPDFLKKNVVTELSLNSLK